MQEHKTMSEKVVTIPMLKDSAHETGTQAEYRSYQNLRMVIYREDCSQTKANRLHTHGTLFIFL